MIELKVEEFEAMMEYCNILEKLVKVQGEKIEILDRALGRK